MFPILARKANETLKNVSRSSVETLENLDLHALFKLLIINPVIVKDVYILLKQYTNTH